MINTSFVLVYFSTPFFIAFYFKFGQVVFPVSIWCLVQANIAYLSTVWTGIFVLLFKPLLYAVLTRKNLTLTTLFRVPNDARANVANQIFQHRVFSSYYLKLVNFNFDFFWYQLWCFGNLLIDPINSDIISFALRVLTVCRFLLDASVIVVVKNLI